MPGIASAVPGIVMSGRHEGTEVSAALETRRARAPRPSRAAGARRRPEGAEPPFASSPRPSEAREVYARGDCWLPSVWAAIVDARAGSGVRYLRAPVWLIEQGAAHPIMGIARGALGLE